MATWCRSWRWVALPPPSPPDVLDTAAGGSIQRRIWRRAVDPSVGRPDAAMGCPPSPLHLQMQQWAARSSGGRPDPGGASGLGIDEWMQRRRHVDTLSGLVQWFSFFFI